MKMTVTLALAALATTALAQDLPRPSPKAQIMQSVGLNDITVSYNRPAVRDRQIWGALVPYDQVWRTGANEATTINFSRDAMVNGKAVPAGIYSLHTIPGRDKWTVILNREAEQWGSYQYDATKDLLRFEVAPMAIPAQERMTFSFPVVTDDMAVLALDWEKVRVPITIHVDTPAHVLAGLRDTMAKNPEDWRVGLRSASWALNASTALDEAMSWIDQSIARNATYQNLALKARMLARAGNRKEAISTAERAIATGKSATPAADVSELEATLAQWRSKK